MEHGRDQIFSDLFVGPEADQKQRSRICTVTEPRIREATKMMVNGWTAVK
jgi:hypothetical protein